MSGVISSYLVHQVQLLINDAGCENFDENDVKSAIRERGYESRYVELVPIETRASGGAITYVTFDAPDQIGWWGKDATLYDSNYDAVTPTSDSNWRIGRWVFSTAPSRPVRILGYSYDLYATAADLLEIRGAQLSESYESLSLAHGSFSYAGKRKGPLEMAKEYRKKQRQSFVRMTRTDVY